MPETQWAALIRVSICERTPPKRKRDPACGSPADAAAPTFDAGRTTLPPSGEWGQVRGRGRGLLGPKHRPVGIEEVAVDLGILICPTITLSCVDPRLACAPSAFTVFAVAVVRD